MEEYRKNNLILNQKIISSTNDELFKLQGRNRREKIMESL